MRQVREAEAGKEIMIYRLHGGLRHRDWREIVRGKSKSEEIIKELFSARLQVSEGEPRCKRKKLEKNNLDP